MYGGLPAPTPVVKPSPTLLPFGYLIVHEGVSELEDTRMEKKNIHAIIFHEIPNIPSCESGIHILPS